MSDIISFTKVSLPHGWLGNMSPHSVVYKEKTYRTTEALFQCLRFIEHPEVHQEIYECKSPMAAKMIAKKYKTLIHLNSQQDISNMKICLHLKIKQHSQLLKQLLETGDKTIVEDCSKRANSKSALFWGARWDENTQSWVGENVLGKLWMQLRKSLQT